ncbi:MAG: ATP-dependent metallopeptidase FtsH/Yme1/Tma family protein, partial [Planctomycetaceae bacterium]
MSESNPTPPPSPENGRPLRPKQGDSRRNDRQQSSNLFWYLMLAVVGAVLLFSLFNNSQQGEELAFSAFEQGLRDGTYDKTNVYELVIGPDYIRFQDKPKEVEARDKDAARTTRKFKVPVYEMGDQIKADLKKLLQEKGIVPDFPPPPPEWHSVVMFIAPLVFILVFFMILVRRMGGAGTAMSFGRSRGRLYAQEDVEVTFNDVAGI